MKPGLAGAPDTAPGEAMRHSCSVNRLAGQPGVTARTLRFHETKGPVAPQRAGNARALTRRDRARLKRVLRGG